MLKVTSAIPSSQQRCATPFFTINGGTSPYHSFGLRVRINNGSASRIVVAFVSMDANVSSDAEMRLTWNAGHGVSDYQYGPGNIAENQQFDGTRTVMDVIPLGPGKHVLTPEVRLSGPAGTPTPGGGSGIPGWHIAAFVIVALHGVGTGIWRYSVLRSGGLKASSNDTGQFVRIRVVRTPAVG